LQNFRFSFKTDVEEAKALIPGLDEYKDEDLKNLLLLLESVKRQPEYS